MGVYQFFQEQKLKAELNEVWDFISSPANLQKITPEYMDFIITSKALPDKMYPGMMISYKVSPLLGIKMTWLTEITHVEDLHYFVDEQRIGPYRLWHHQHFIEPIEGGVLMKDIVTYAPPFGILGNLANYFIIQRKLKEIFDFRTIAMKKHFETL